MPNIVFEAPFEVTTSILAGRLRLENGTFVLPLENGVATYTGDNLTINPVGGQIRTYEERHDGELVFSITGLSINAADLFTANISPERVFDLFYARNDTVTGSYGRDVIDTLGGRDIVRAGDGNDEIRAGAGNDRVDGGDGRDLLFGLSGADRISGGGGNDIVNGGSGNDRLAGGSGKDRLIGGAGDDSLHGDSGRDALFGGDGADTLDGGGGSDRMEGGSGDDTYIVARGDTVSESADAGHDRVVTQLRSFTLGANLEDLELSSGRSVTGEGNALDNRIVVTGDTRTADLLGHGGDDLLVGGDGDDTLNGGSGDDDMRGGAGNDFYHVDTFGDSVTEDAGAGTDTVETDLDGYHLAAQVENLVLNGAQAELTATGNDLDNLITGSSNAGRNILFGDGGNDTLRGTASNDALDGGTGDDLMSGGDGDDSYTVDQIGDMVEETEGHGQDRVYTTLLAYTLGENVEELIILGTSSEANDVYRGTGNQLANYIEGALAFGNDLAGLEGDDILVGGREVDFLSGGEGADTLTGAGGRDQLLGGNGDDALNGDAGGDTLLGGNGDDRLSGGGGNDTLDGGAGDDVMEGGAGADTYIVDSLGDTVIEDADSGRDTVQTDLTEYTLSENVEDLVLTGFSADDTEVFSGTGNAADNEIRGSEINDNSLSGLAGDDILIGGDAQDALQGGADDDVLIGGAGGDILTGGAGSDVFYFGALEDSRTASGDVISDFVQGEDFIEFGVLVEGLHIDLLTLDAPGGELFYYHVSGPDPLIVTSDMAIISEIVAGNTIIRVVDNDPDAGAPNLDLDFAVTIVGEFALTIDDFLF